MSDFFSIGLKVLENLPYILAGSLTTISVVTLALALGFIIGIPLALIQVYGPRKIAFVVKVYVWFFRGIPILVMLFLLYFMVFVPLFNLSAFFSATLVLGFTSAAYQSQIFRGAINSLPQGQLKAAKAVGMSNLSAIESIILPQALRLALPGWSNEFSILLKDSALIYLLGVSDIMARVDQVVSREQVYFVFYALEGVLYFIITLIGIRLLRKLEVKTRIPGLGIQ